MDIESIQNFINGRKTYFVAITSIIAVAIGWSEKKIPDMTALEQVVGLILAITIRHGVDTAADTAANPPKPTATDDGIKITLK